MPDNQFSRDASNRLVFEMFCVPCRSYDDIVEELRTAFNLVPVGPGIDVWDIVFRDYQREGAVVGLEWDNWLGFIVVAKSPAAESLVNEIGAYLLASRWAQFTSPA